MEKGKLWKNESKAIGKRVLIGVLTTLATTSAIYFLGFNRPAKKADELEVKKNSIQVWKDMVALENQVLGKHDSIFNLFNNKILNTSAYVQNDSLVSAQFLIKMTDLEERKDIDGDMRSLLVDRKLHKQDELNRFLSYSRRFQALQDTVADGSIINELEYELSETFVQSRSSAFERMGRSMEDRLAFLSTKYKYDFKIKDIAWHNYYLQLRAQREVKNEPIPPLPNTPQ